MRLGPSGHAPVVVGHVWVPPILTPAERIGFSTGDIMCPLSSDSVDT